MNLKKKLNIGATVVGVTVFAAVGIVTGTAIAGSNVDPIDKYPLLTNESGQTYGSRLSTPPDASPDLILVNGDNGLLGYVYADELDTPAPSSPEEALAQQAPPGAILAVLNVYDSDGKTVVDTFTIRQSEHALQLEQ